MVYKAAIVYMNAVQFTLLKHEPGYCFGVSYKFYSMSCSSEDGKFGSNVSFLGKLQNLRPRRRLDGTVDIYWASNRGPGPGLEFFPLDPGDELELFHFFITLPRLNSVTSQS